MVPLNQNTNRLSQNIIKTLTKSTFPLSVDDITSKLSDNDIHYDRRHVARVVKSLHSDGIIEFLGKRKGGALLYSIPGQELEPWEAISPPTKSKRPTISFNGSQYSPDQLADQLIRQTGWSFINDSTNREVLSQLTIAVLGNAAYSTLQAHSITPVAHVRRPLEEFNEKLLRLSSLIESILKHPLVKTGESGNSITNRTRDFTLEELEPWLMELSINVRSNINEG